MSLSGRVWFRADASAAIGSGHVTRCFALALALHRRGAAPGLLSRKLPAALADQWTARGFAVASIETDADEIGAATEALASRDCDVLVVDHYALDAEWEAALRGTGRSIVAIDDLANRPHDVDLLLDQNLGRTLRDYEPWLPAHCARLIGPGYALLRPEFATARAASLSRRKHGQLRHVVISMGGSDPGGFTPRVLTALAHAGLSQALRVTVVMGSLAPTLTDVRRIAAGMPGACEVLVDVRCMAALLADADLAIGAAGGTAWERCCLGLPSLVLIVADNQRVGAHALDAAGAARLLCDGSEAPAAIQALFDPQALKSLSRNAADIADGLGAERVAEAVLAAACA